MAPKFGAKGPGRTSWPRKLLVHLIAIALTAAIIFLLTISLEFDKFWAQFLLDHGKNTLFRYPFTIQNGMYLIMAIALAELWTRWREAEHEHALIDRHLLPEDDETILQFSDLGAIRRRASELQKDSGGYLPHLISLSILQVFTSKSVDQTIAVLHTSVELIMHRVELQYQLLRYILWLIPTIGFIGTVVGISYALFDINPDKPDLATITARLGLAFYTTIVALMQSVLLVLLQNIIQKRDELAVNLAATYCIKNLVNRLYIPK